MVLDRPGRRRLALPEDDQRAPDRQNHGFYGGSGLIGLKTCPPAGDSPLSENSPQKPVKPKIISEEGNADVNRQTPRALAP